MTDLCAGTVVWFSAFMQDYVEANTTKTFSNEPGIFEGYRDAPENKPKFEGKLCRIRTLDGTISLSLDPKCITKVFISPKEFNDKAIKKLDDMSALVIRKFLKKIRDLEYWSAYPLRIEVKDLQFSMTKNNYLLRRVTELLQPYMLTGDDEPIDFKVEFEKDRYDHHAWVVITI